MKTKDFELDIEKVNNYFEMHHDCGEHYNPIKYPIVYGYNGAFSGRNGGKTTNILAWCIAAYMSQGCIAMYIRTVTKLTTKKYMQNLFTDLNYLQDDAGFNMLENLTNRKYNNVYYDYLKKCFLMRNINDDTLEPVPILYVNSLDNYSDMRSSINLPNCNIIFFDEILDDLLPPQPLLKLMHIMKTIFKNRSKSVVFLTGNLETGNFGLLQEMGIYNKIRGDRKPFTVYETQNGTKIAVELFTPQGKKADAYDKMNSRFFDFNIEGIEVIHGQAFGADHARRLPDLINDNWLIERTPLIFHSLGMYLAVYHCVCQTWQSLYLVKYCTEPPQDTQYIVLTDDKNELNERPYTYYNVGKQFLLAKDFATKFLRNDVVFEDDLCQIATEAFYHNHLK